MQLNRQGKMVPEPSIETFETKHGHLWLVFNSILRLIIKIVTKMVLSVI